MREKTPHRTDAVKVFAFVFLRIRWVPTGMPIVMTANRYGSGGDAGAALSRLQPATPEPSTQPARRRRVVALNLGDHRALGRAAVSSQRRRREPCRYPALAGAGASVGGSAATAPSGHRSASSISSVSRDDSKVPVAVMLSSTQSQVQEL